VRRSAPVVFLAIGVIALLTWWIVYTQRVVTELRREASRSGKMYARVYQALADRNDDGTSALLDMSRYVREQEVPVIVTDAKGQVTAAANLPFEAPLDDPRVREYIRVLDALNPPVEEPGIGKVHFGNTPLVQGLRVVPFIQVTTLSLFLFAGIYALVTRGRAERERVWAGMAREAAHQLGTPLTSLEGWVELLSERASDPIAAEHMRGDLDRLGRVANRFERIGRPPQKDPVDVGGIARDVATYFRARVPTLAHTVLVDCTVPTAPLLVEGDAVLLEWALESLVRNAVDALAGRGGRVELVAEPLPEGGARVVVADDGPGVPAKLRTDIFKAGFTTKPRGWGIGLALARRIVTDNHRGRLVLLPTEKGAAFEITLQG
jgi:signal transduction histidine kinase